MNKIAMPMTGRKPSLNVFNPLVKEKEFKPSYSPKGIKLGRSNHIFIKDTRNNGLLVSNVSTCINGGKHIIGTGFTKDYTKYREYGKLPEMCTLRSTKKRKKHIGFDTIKNAQSSVVESGHRYRVIRNGKVFKSI